MLVENWPARGFNLKEPSGNDVYSEQPISLPGRGDSTSAVRLKKFKGTVIDKDPPSDPMDKDRHLIDCVSNLLPFYLPGLQ